jgi:hypothetical protein
VDKLAADRTRYGHDAEDIQNEAKSKETETAHEEAKALRLDIGEGFLELGLVMSSLYFLSKRKFFPIIGGAAAVIGAALGVIGFLI